MRKIMAKGIEARAMPGRIRCLSASQEASHSRVSSPSRTKKPVTRVASTSCRPETGSQPSSIAKTYLSRKARKKTGTATPMSEPTMERLSSRLARLRAAR